MVTLAGAAGVGAAVCLGGLAVDAGLLVARIAHPGCGQLGQHRIQRRARRGPSSAAEATRRLASFIEVRSVVANASGDQAAPTSWGTASAPSAPINT